MLVDADDWRDGTTISADLCILGAGAAGVTLAHSLRDTTHSIAVFESGAITTEAPTQALYAGTYSGNIPSVNASYLSGSRIRMFGGSTNLWGGYCRPLDPLDFTEREWVPDSGWPISRTDLDPFYRAASAELGIPTFDAPPEYLADPKYAALFASESLGERLYQFRYVNLGTRHLDDFKASKKTTVYLHANAVDLALNPAGSAIDHVALATLSGKRATARAKLFVLATGGIENARLLLASRGVNPKGVGNDADLVGRYFMEHPCIANLGPLFVWKRLSLSRYDVKVVDREALPGSAPTMGTAMFIAPSDATLRARKLVSVTAQLSLGSTLNGGLNEFDHSVMRAAADLDGETAHGGFVEPERAALAFTSENAPNRESRVKLGTELDPLGVPKPDLDWRLGNQELEAILALAEMLAGVAGNLRLGRARLTPTRDDLLHSVGWGNHHMGTTRMSSDPKRGVVDANCQVHGVGNLFVAGSSVFPTSGAANPTYTILALALRLSKHLRGRLS